MAAPVGQIFSQILGWSMFFTLWVHFYWYRRTQIAQLYGPEE